MDDRKGVIVAERKGLTVTGTLGVLAADRGLVDFSQAIKKLEGTSFRRPEVLLDSLLKKHARGAGPSARGRKILGLLARIDP